MPMESMGSGDWLVGGGVYLSARVFKYLNSFLTNFSSYEKDAIPINPMMAVLEKLFSIRAICINLSNSFSSKPNFVSSFAIYTCSKQSIVLLFFFACL